MIGAGLVLEEQTSLIELYPGLSISCVKASSVSCSFENLASFENVFRLGFLFFVFFFLGNA